MSLLISNSRRRKLLFAAAAIAAGGYASYRIYKSSDFSRRKKQLLQIISTMFFFGEAVSQSAESISILSKDLKSFLLSDEDSVPRSLKQAFKIGQCAEFQETMTVLSAALTRGLLRGANAKSRKEGNGRGWGQSHGHGEPLKVESFRGRQFRDADVSGEDVACREIREVCFTTNRQEGSKDCCLEYEKEGISLASVEKGGPAWQEWEIKSYSSGAELHSRRSRKVGIVLDKVRRGQKESKSSEELPDRLLSKLFSEPGVGFTSAVAGALARNFVLAFFNGVRNQSATNKGPGSSSSSNDQLGADNSVDKKTPGYAKILDVISTNPCRALIAECIQTFISTAVTVYIDKTKDVNFYNDMVAGITNPSHRDPMKDVIASVCNGAVETLVRTSYGVIFAEKNGQLHSYQQSQKNLWEIQEHSPQLSVQRQLPRSSMETHDEVIAAHSSSLEGKTMDPCTSGEPGTADAQLIPNTSGTVSDRNFPGDEVIAAHSSSLEGKTMDPCTSGEPGTADAQLIPNTSGTVSDINFPVDEVIAAHSSSLEGKTMDPCTSGEPGTADTQLIPNTCGTVSDRNFPGNNTGGMQSLIDGVSKTLAIPSNRKLVVDVAGTMTSEAVRSFVEVVLSTGSRLVRTKVHGGWDKVKRSVSDCQGLQLQGRSRDVVVKAFVLASICLAICLHMLTVVRVPQSA